ncbi:MAG: gamma-glutamylcyclotransferase family protein [Candidatus Eiseniibacteriota bacterium]
MLDFFVYGTLLDDAVRAAVIGRDTALLPATLAGFRRVPVTGQSFPVVIVDPRGKVEGALVAGLDVAEAARLSYFEGSAYQALRQRVALADGALVEAWLFVPAPRQPFAPGLRPRPGQWDLAAWQRRHKPGYLRGLRRAMAAPSKTEIAALRLAWQERARQPAKSDAPRPRPQFGQG